MTIPSKKLQKMRNKYVPQAVFQLTEVAIAKAKGAKIWDIEGKEYIDFVGGIGCVNAGHCPDSVVRAIQNQAEHYIQPSINVVNYQSYIEVAEKLCAITPGKYNKQAVLFNSGAEAVENSIKIARYSTKRSAVLCFEAGYHGRTLLAMSLTSKIRPYKYGYGPFAPEIYQIPHPVISKIVNYDNYWQHIFTSLVAAEDVAAIIFEPELGEGGFIPMPQEFVQKMRDICTGKGIFMIADEVQTGFCRTGKLFAMQHYDVLPDLFVLGKSIASGMPLTAVVGNKKLMSSSHVGGLGGTFCGNPLSCAAALATLKIYDDLHLADRAVEIGAKTKELFTNIRTKYPQIGEIHGLGAMIGIEFVDEHGNASADILHKVMHLALENGVILMSSGMQGNVMRTLMPLVITDEELATAFNAIEKAIASV